MYAPIFLHDITPEADSERNERGGREKKKKDPLCSFLHKGSDYVKEGMLCTCIYHRLGIVVATEHYEQIAHHCGLLLFVERHNVFVA